MVKLPTVSQLQVHLPNPEETIEDEETTRTPWDWQGRGNPNKIWHLDFKAGINDEERFTGTRP